MCVLIWVGRLPPPPSLLCAGGEGVGRAPPPPPSPPASFLIGLLFSHLLDRQAGRAIAGPFFERRPSAARPRSWIPAAAVVAAVGRLERGRGFEIEGVSASFHVSNNAYIANYEGACCLHCLLSQRQKSSAFFFFFFFLLFAQKLLLFFLR